MRRRLFLAASAAAAALPVLAAAPAFAAEPLRVGGTGGAAGMLAQLAAPFTRQTGIAVDVIPSLGSRGGIAAAADGVLDIAVSGRPLSPAELARGLVQSVGMRTPYVLATSYASPPSMAGSAVVDVFAAQKSTWPDGSSVKLVLRPRAESDNQVLEGLFHGMAAALEAARQRPELPVAATDQDNADVAEKLPGSLIGITYTQIVTEQRNLRLIPLDGVAPSMETFAAGTYPYTKLFYLVHPPSPGAAATRFLAFLNSEAGVRALRQAGCLPGGG